MASVQLTHIRKIHTKTDEAYDEAIEKAFYVVRNATAGRIEEAAMANNLEISDKLGLKVSPKKAFENFREEAKAAHFRVGLRPREVDGKPEEAFSVIVDFGIQQLELITTKTLLSIALKKQNPDGKMAYSEIITQIGNQIEVKKAGTNYT